MSGISYSALSERGLRPRNDDAYCAEKIGRWFLLAVADGLAGHEYGELASRAAIDALKAAVKESAGPARDTLTAGVRNADAEIRALSRSSPKHSGLATKLVACLIDEKGACTVLDTGGQNCTVISATMVETAAEAAKSRNTGPRTAVAGPKPPSLSDMISHVLGEPYRLKETDFAGFVLGSEYLLLSSDGLTNFLTAGAIAGIVRNAKGNLEVACEKLVQDATTAGSDSTITVVLAHRTGKLAGN